MRKSGWAAAAGLGSLVLLLAACGGSSSSSSAAGTASSTATQGTAVSSSSSASATPTSSSRTSSPSSTSNAKPTSSNSSSGNTAQAQPSTNPGVTFPPVGTTVLIVQHSSLGWVMAEASGLVVYTYAKDTKGGTPTCTGSCASVWAPVTGVPKAGPADNFPGTFGLVTAADGVKQITYNGYPLYLYKGAAPLSTKGNGIDGVWHVVPLSAGDITS
jgi:predicted lipoprotein with Yx(FWY)xxD motif